MEAPEKEEEIVSDRTGKLAGTVNWGTATVVGVFAGLLYGGSKAASESVVSNANRNRDSRWLHLELVAKANGSKWREACNEEAKSGIAVAIERLEGNLEKRP